MITTTPARYSPGGDIYQSLTEQYGIDAANRAYSASHRDDGGTALRFALSDIHASKEGRTGGYGDAELNTSTGGIFFDQITTDPLGAPLEGLNNQLGKVIWNVVKNPWVLVTVALLIAWKLGLFNKLLKK
jgi:hypothetical protein